MLNEIMMVSSLASFPSSSLYVQALQRATRSILDGYGLVGKGIDDR